MRVTIFSDRDGAVTATAQDMPRWQPFADWQGEALERVSLVGVDQSDGAEVQLVRIAAGGHFVMHASPDLAFCQVVKGAGTLRLPGGRDLRYAGPELYVFHPNTLHEWLDVTVDTLLSVCLVRVGQ